MSSQPNNPLQNDIVAQANSTSVSATGRRITQEMNDCVLSVYNTSKNCQTFLSSVPPDDKSYLRILLVMCHPLDNEAQKRIQNLINIKVLSKKAVRQTSDCYIDEVRRRAGWLKTKNGKRKYWRIHQCKESIEENVLNPSKHNFAKTQLENYLKKIENDCK